MRKGPIHVNWFTGGTTNICYNALDRHVKEGRGDVPCFLWEGNEPKDALVMTYKQVGVTLGCVAVAALISSGASVGPGAAAPHLEATPLS